MYLNVIMLRNNTTLIQKCGNKDQLSERCGKKKLPLFLSHFN